MPRTLKKDLPRQIKLRGRTFTKRELATIRQLVKRYYDKGRTSISKAICEKLEWKQPNGWLKDRACRDVLLRLEKLRFIKLPPRKIERCKTVTTESRTKPRTQATLVAPITKYPETLSLELAKGNDAEQIWNQVVNVYHYLGHKVVVGRCLKYLVRADGELVGAISFSSPAWHLEPRDRLLADYMNAGEVHNLVINNSRFLILPNVQVPNLASAVLSLATRQVVLDWSKYYSITPLFVETFVEPNRFLGTCYKAANWIEIGTTKGYAKKGDSYHNSQQPKQIFLYGLNRVMRRKILSAVKRETIKDD